MTEVYFTKHAQDRFAERFPEKIKDGNLISSMSKVFEGTTRERGFLNNTAYLMFMLEKYGDFNFDFYINNDVVFLCREDRVVTVMRRDDFGMAKLHGSSKGTPRFRKRVTS